MVARSVDRRDLGNRTLQLSNYNQRVDPIVNEYNRKFLENCSILHIESAIIEIALPDQAEVSEALAR